MKIFYNALKTSLPALLCYLPLGAVYGALCTQEGLSWYYAPLFSTFVLAGAMQFLALTILAAGSSILTLALSLIPLGIRNIFYGLTMLERYRTIHPLLRLYLAHGLVDATYSLLETKSYPDEKEDCKYITCLTILIHAYWVCGSLVGSILAHVFTLPAGLEFSLTAFFAAAAVEQFLVKKTLKPILIAALSICVAFFVFPNHFFLAGIAIAILTAISLPKKEERGIA